MKNTKQVPSQGEKLPFKRNRKKVSKSWVLLIIIIIMVVSLTFVSVWSPPIEVGPPDGDELIIADAYQSDGNMTSGCLFVITKGSGKGVKFEDIVIKVGKKGEVPIKLRWHDDGNFTYELDSTYNDIWWDAAETMGFDAPPELQAQNIVDGDTIEVSIVKIVTGSIVFQGEFVYRE